MRLSVVLCLNALVSCAGSAIVDWVFRALRCFGDVLRIIHHHSGQSEHVMLLGGGIPSVKARQTQQKATVHIAR